MNIVHTGIMIVHYVMMVLIHYTRYGKKMGEIGGQNAHSTLNTDCESGV